jgi:4-amino-4-deoxy-L-arabinose transferase-like glycosyltransferase
VSPESVLGPEAAITNTKSETVRATLRSQRKFFSWLVVTAFVLRLGLILINHTYKFKPIDDNFGFGFEMGRIGRSLAQGQGFANPFNETTGPTAWEPPLYPLMIAALFKCLGIYTKGSAFVLLAINSLFSALTCVPIYLNARRCFGEKVGRWSAWLWAVLPNVMFWCTRWVWETSLAALLLALIFWLALDMEEGDGRARWVQFGLLWGVAALTNPALLSFLPVSGIWVWYRRWKRGERSLAGIGVSSVLFVLCLAPWAVRNYRTFGQFILLRSNFGAELRIGNGPLSDGTWQQYLHPTQNVYEMRRYREMGEMAYVDARKREALAFIRADYPRFARLCLKRFIYYWAGRPRLSEIPALAPFNNSLFLASSVLAVWGLARAVRKHVPGIWLFFWLILLYPAVYYIVFPHARYRHPIEPELGILMVYIASQAERTGKGRGQGLPSSNSLSPAELAQELSSNP